MDITLPLTSDITKLLKAGDEVFLNGPLLVGRDQAHKRLFELMEEGKSLPVDLTGETIFYMGPSPTPEGGIIGSAGPTTANRMDSFAPALMDAGLKGMVAKGDRGPGVYEAIKRNSGVYFYAFGGCGALYSRAIKNQEVLAFPELGPEALRRLEVENFPVIVAIDSRGNSLFYNKA